MIRLKQILFSPARDGILLILLLLSRGEVTGQSRDTTISVASFRELGRQFMQKGEYQLSYFYNYSYYLLAADSVKRADAILDAVDACLLTGKYPEAERLIFDAEDFGSSFSDQLKIRYGYTLTRQGEYTKAGIYLNRIGDPGQFSNQYHFLQAYVDLNTNRPAECINNLKLIDNSFPEHNEINSLITALGESKKARKKHLILSMPMSAVLPGLGQAYSGFYFDALQSFGLNAAFGLGAYSAWRYELTKDKPDRNYVLPGLTTLIFSVFYISNLYNTANVTQKANLYAESERIRRFSERFDIVLENSSYFVRFRIRM